MRGGEGGGWGEAGRMTTAGVGHYESKSTKIRCQRVAERTI